MSEISSLPADTLKEALHGRLFYNPLQQEYEIAERWIAGNVVEKADEVRAYLENNPDDTEAKESLTALEEARPNVLNLRNWILTSANGGYLPEFMPVSLRTCSMRMYWFIIPKAPMTFP
jgi:hypothetical protein